MVKHRKMSWFVHVRKGAVTLCFLLVLMGLATPSAFASTRSRNAAPTAADLSPQSRLQHGTELGTFDFGGIIMVNEHVGWTFTDKVQRTSDGGKTWQIVARGNAQEFIGAVEVLDAQTVWYRTDDAQTYAPTALYRTTDGGQTWTRFAWIDPSQHQVSISMLDGQSAWVDTSDTNGVYHLYLVGGSGQTWQAVTSPGPNGANNIYFISKKVGWATVVNSGDFNPTYTLYATRDGGQTWVQQNLALPASVPATAIASSINFSGFGDQDEGYLTAYLSDSASYTTYAIQTYRTLDGGRSWQPYGDPKPESQNDNIGFVIQIDQWNAAAAGFAFIVINGQVGLGTLLDGQWQEKRITLPSNGYFLTVLTARVMFVSGPTPDGSAQDLYKTLDGGTTWQKITTLLN